MPDEPTTDAHETDPTHALDEGGAERYPPTLRLTVQSASDAFALARQHARAADREDTDGPATEAVRGVDSVDALRRLLTPRRVEIMQSLIDASAPSIRALADRLGRNYRDVYEDVALLAEHEIVYYAPGEGTARRPVIPYTEIVVDVTLAQTAASPPERDHVHG